MSVPRSTEMTVRSLLQKELEKRGVKVTPEVTFVTPVGRRMTPDLVLRNSGDYVVETKLGAEAKLIDALVQLYDYSKYSDAKGAFAILFPAQLRTPWPYEMLEKISADPKLSYKVAGLFKDQRPTQQFAGNLSEIADWIARHVLKPPVIEADTSIAIRALSDVVDYITASTRQLEGKELEDIFGGEAVFENLLQYEKGKYPIEEMRKAAVYLLINQILFYHILSNVDTYYSPIDETKISRPGDLAGYFNRVLEKDYASTFGFDVASRLPENSTKMVRKAIMVIKALAPEKIGQDVLGKVFHELIPFEIRKAVAAFYTNNEAAEILAQLTIDDPKAKVMDLAVGSGTLLVASYRRKKELLKGAKGDFGFEDHKRFLEEDLTGVDIMPFAAHLAVVHLSLQALIFETEKVRVGVWDSIELKPGQVLPAVSRELRAAYKRPTLDMFAKGKPSTKETYIQKGAVTLEGVGGEDIPLEKVDVAIMNPPFTRQERLPKEYKKRLATYLKGYEKYIHGQLGLYGYFVLLGDRFVNTDGKLALVLPATILRVKSAKGVRRLLTENYQIEHIISTWQRAAFSEGAQFREILLVAKKVKPAKSSVVNKENASKCTITVLKRLPTNLEGVKDFTSTIKTFVTSDNAIYEDENIATYKVTQDYLKKLVDNMFTLIAVQDSALIDLWTRITDNASEKLERFDEYLTHARGWIKESVRSRRGGSVHSLFILANESRAIKKKDTWIVDEIADELIKIRHRFLGKIVSVPMKSVRRGLRRPLATMDITDKLDYIITRKFEDLDEVTKISMGTTNTSFIRAWQKYVEERMGNLAVMRRFDISAPGSTLLTFYSSVPIVAGVVTWPVKIPRDKDSRILTVWFNSSINILQLLLNRSETRGAFLEISKYILDKFLILDPQNLSEREKKSLLHVFEKVKDATFPSILDQLKKRFPLRVEIDKAVLKVLGFGDDEIDRILDYLYPALANEIQQLKTLMTG